MDARLALLLRKLYGIAETGAEAYGAANSPLSPEHAATVLSTLADFSPIGDAKSAYDGVQAAWQGDWWSAGGGLLGALPGVPNLAGVVGGKLFRAQKPGLMSQMSEPLLNMSPGRGSGHLGTGTYWVGDKERLGSLGASADREIVESVIPKGMFTPKDEEAGFALHDGLRLLNDAVYDSKLDTRTLEKIRNYFDRAELPFDVQKIRDSLAEAKNISGRRRTWDDQRRLGEGKDSASTVYMRSMGFSGVDTTGLPRLDNTRYGTVIYRPK